MHIQPNERFVIFLIFREEDDGDRVIVMTDDKRVQPGS